MARIRVLFLNLSREGDDFQEAYRNMLDHLRSTATVELQEVASLEIAKRQLTDIDIFLLWVNSENSHVWHDLVDFKYENKHLDYIGFIIIFGFRVDVQKKARDAMSRGVYAFACPFNHDVLEAYIESIHLEIKHKRSLSEFEEYLFQAQNLSEIIKKALLELKTHPLVGYDRATISLIDQETGRRYLLEYDASSPYPNRQLLRIIHEDKLITCVDKRGILIIDNLEDLRINKPELLADLGWEDTDATSDIKSWVGLAAKRQGQSIAIITLDCKSPEYYRRYDDKLNRFLEDFSRILADTIVDFLQERNARVVREITREIGDDLESEALMRQILVKIKDELDCDNCTYFRVSSLQDVNEILLEEWVAANDPSTVEEQPKRNKRSFKQGVGIVGSVLADGKSRIVPHALESEEFEPTFRLPGTNLSMLAVPVIPYIDENELSQRRIIGVISCYKARKDHFTIYDRALVESIAQSTATVIERTMTLEYSNDISSQVSDLIFDTNKTNLLRTICEHALKVTSARGAVIHRLKYSTTLPNGEEKYHLTGEYYTFPEGIEEPLPRLDGEGTTDIVIREKQIKEFSRQFGNFDNIAEDLRNKGVRYQIIVPLMIKDKTKKNQLLIIGALYLNKYSEEPFSEVEKFALKLFASQAASTIYHQEFLSERLTWTKANTDLAKAIEAIASRNDPALLLRDIARYSYSLVDANLSYLAFLNENDDFEFKAAWPESVLAELDEFHKNRKESDKEKIGITKLAAKRGETILIPDLQKEQKNKTEEGRAYIEFREGMRSEMAVPIIIKEGEDKRVIGVINLEDEEPYAFTEVHQEVIEHFARQIAISFQKKSLVESASSKKNILIGLQQSLQKIIESPLQNILHNAVLLTREAVKADEVIVIEAEKKKWKPELLLKKAVPDINHKYQVIAQILEEVSLQVFSSQQSVCCCDFKSLIHQKRLLRSERSFSELPASSGLCLPFSSRDERIGVMWMLFSKPLGKELSEEDEAIYQVYANQIALAYMNAKQSEELKQKVAKSAFELTSNIHDNYKDARNQAISYFLLSIISSLLGIMLIFYGIFNLLGNTSSNIPAASSSSQTANNSSSQMQSSTSCITPVQQGGITTAIGVFLQAITILAFNRGKAANERMDRYHRELYTIRQLEILLSAADQLDSGTVPQVKQQIIQNATNSWIQAVNEINKSQMEIKDP